MDRDERCKTWFLSSRHLRSHDLISITKFIEWITVEPPYHEGPTDRQNVFAILGCFVISRVIHCTR